MKIITTVFILFLSITFLKGNPDSLFIQVHFLYGSKPQKAFKGEERKWFGGILGGHVGIEYDSNKVINFLPSGGVNIFASSKNIQGYFTEHNRSGFWSVFGGEADKVKKATVIIPISLKQYQKLDSIANQYLAESPYDYAFFGMRCGASTYEILAQIGL